MNKVVLSIFCAAIIAGPIACNDDGSDGNGGSEPTGAYISADNAELIAGAGAAVLDFLPGLTQALGLLLERIDEVSSPGGLQGVIDLGDLGFCSTGSAVASWNDVDEDGVLSPGDRAGLEVVDCDGEVDGTLEIAFLTIGEGAGSADLDLALAFRDDVGGGAATMAVTGRFRMDVDFSGVPGSSAFRYYVPEKTDGSLGMKSTLNGITLFEIGCFDLFFQLNLLDGGYSLHNPLAVLKFPGLGIASMVGFTLPPLQFTGDSYPESGQLAFYGEADVLPCARLGVPGGGVDSNDSFFILTATGNGNLTLTGETDAGVPFTVETTWDEIR